MVNNGAPPQFERELRGSSYTDKTIELCRLAVECGGRLAAAGKIDRANKCIGKINVSR